MTTQDLIAGYAAYTDAGELGSTQADAPAITPTVTITTSSGACIAISTVSAVKTIDGAC